MSTLIPGSAMSAYCMLSWGFYVSCLTCNRPIPALILLIKLNKWNAFIPPADLSGNKILVEFYTNSAAWENVFSFLDASLAKCYLMINFSHRNPLWKCSVEFFSTLCLIVQLLCHFRLDLNVWAKALSLSYRISCLRTAEDYSHYLSLFCFLFSLPLSPPGYMPKDIENIQLICCL